MILLGKIKTKYEIHSWLSDSGRDVVRSGAQPTVHWRLREYIFIEIIRLVYSNETIEKCFIANTCVWCCSRLRIHSCLALVTSLLLLSFASYVTWSRQSSSMATDIVDDDNNFLLVNSLALCIQFKFTRFRSARCSCGWAGCRIYDSLCLIPLFFAVRQSF